MQRIAVLCLMSSVLLFVRSLPAGDQKPAKLSLSEEAQLFGAKEGKTRWVSAELVLVTAKKDVKTHTFMRFEPVPGKPTGKAELGEVFRSEVEEAGSDPNYTFELVEQKDGQRAIKLINTSVVELPSGKPVPRPYTLYYSLADDTLTVWQPPLPGWGELSVKKIQFKREK